MHIVHRDEMSFDDQIKKKEHQRLYHFADLSTTLAQKILIVRKQKNFTNLSTEKKDRQIIGKNKGHSHLNLPNFICGAVYHPPPSP